jgi:TrmH family RNA methyltransferase
MKTISPYKKESQTSYAAGAYAVIELLQARPLQTQAVAIHSGYNGAADIEELCKQNNVPIIRNDKLFKRINQKENTYVLGIFTKYQCRLSPDRPHVVLVNPSDMGNLGTIIRSLAGFGITDTAIITPAADVWNPKTIRASMGAVFGAEIETFPSFDIYRERFSRHNLYPFILSGGTPLTAQTCPKTCLYALIFGNEATGLPPHYQHIGTPLTLPQSAAIDSLNLSAAVAVGAYIFAVTNNQIK